jgi:hypothetical protein
MPRLLLIVFALVLVIAPSAQAADRGARAAAVCTAPKYPGSGYFTSLSVTKVTCATGKKVALSYYRCRTKTGPKGRCVKKVEGYSCVEQRTSIATEINGRVTCKRGSRKVVHTYQQNL